MCPRTELSVQPVDIAGDVRYSSMYHPAVYYGLYTMMEASSNKVTARKIVIVSSLYLDLLVMVGLITCACADFHL